MLMKVLFKLIKENHGLREDDYTAERMIQLHLMKRQNSSVKVS
jgi:hypothetical protein